MEDKHDLKFLQAASHLTGKGFKVFPVRPGSKFPPLFEGWQQKASRDPAVIKNWWTRWPLANPAILMSDGFFALDVDVRRNGLQTLAILKEKWGALRPTYSQTTPTGGLHVIYFSSTEIVPSSKDRFGEGIEIKGTGSYVLGAGSVIEGKYYVEN